MPTVKRRIFAGVVCEQEVYTVTPKTKTKNAKPTVQRFRSEKERQRHKWLISRRHHVRIVNENYTPQSLYVTLTYDDDHYPESIEQVRRDRDNYVRRLKRINPDVKINAYIGRGRRSGRLHMHLLIDGIDAEEAAGKWTNGAISRVEHLRKHNIYDGTDHGADYTALANYLFDHWTEEQGEGSHRYFMTRTVRQPETETPKPVKRAYSIKNPPKAPKGYRLVAATATEWGYMNFKYIKETTIETENSAQRPQNEGGRRI